MLVFTFNSFLISFNVTIQHKSWKVFIIVIIIIWPNNDALEESLLCQIQYFGANLFSLFHILFVLKGAQHLILQNLTHTHSKFSIFKRPGYTEVTKRKVGNYQDFVI